MKRKLFAAILFILSAAVNSQQSNTLYFMYRVPQSSFLNPARQFPCQFYISVPLLSSIHANVSSTAFSVKSISDVSGNVMQINTDKILKHTHNLDHISTEVHYTLLSMGFKKFDYYYTFSLTEKNEFYLSLPNDLTMLAVKANGYFMDKDKSVQLRRLAANMLHYREYAFGASKQVDDDLQMGFRAKLLFGKANVNTRVRNLSIHTNPETFDLTFKSNATINASGPILLNTNADGYISDVSFDESAPITKLIFNGRNPGLSLDGGFFYQYNDDITLSGSFNDLGFIWWRSYLNNATQNGEFTFVGQTEANAANGSLMMHIMDTVRTTFAPTFTKKSYLTMLPLKGYLGAEYRLTNYLRAGVLGRLWLYQYRFHPSVTLHASLLLTRFITLTANYSFHNYNLRNLGGGLTFQTRNVQFYLLTDNYAAAIWMNSARNVNLRFGFNLFFGCGGKGGKGGVGGRRGHGNMNCAGCYWYQSMEEKRRRRD